MVPVEKNVFPVSRPDQECSDALRDLMAVRDAGRTGMIIGGMAVIAFGYPWSGLIEEQVNRRDHPEEC